MATYPFAVDVHAAPIVRKNESIRVLINYPSGTGITAAVKIIDPSGREIPVTIKTTPAFSGWAGVSAHYFDFTFGSIGTYMIFVYISVAPTPDIYTGSCVVHVPAWLDNIDKPISDITKSNTEISRLRTQYDRAKSGGI